MYDYTVYNLGEFPTVYAFLDLNDTRIRRPPPLVNDLLRTAADH